LRIRIPQHELDSSEAQKKLAHVLLIEKIPKGGGSRCGLNPLTGRCEPRVVELTHLQVRVAATLLVQEGALLLQALPTHIYTHMEVRLARDIKKTRTLDKREGIFFQLIHLATLTSPTPNSKKAYRYRSAM
jgi:hypothetical protein